MSSGLIHYGARWARVDGAKVNMPRRLRREVPQLRNRSGQERKKQKEAEEGSAAVAEPLRPVKKEAANAFIAVATEEPAAVGGNLVAAAEDVADIASCTYNYVHVNSIVAAIA